MRDEPLRILYLEDKPEVSEEWLPFIRRTWGEECCGARSREMAIRLIEDGFVPDLVIFDRSILFFEGDEIDSERAGDQLYFFLCKRKIPTAVFTGHNDLEFVEPYASHPPLGYFAKPFREDALRAAVDLYRRSRVGSP